MDIFKDMPLVPLVSAAIPTDAADHDTLKDRERKRAEHRILTTEFSAAAQDKPSTPSNSPDYIVTLSKAAPAQTILTYEYNPAKGRITLQTFKP